MLGGVEYSARLSKFLINLPTDPVNNLAASWHVYNFSWCNNRACWDSDALPVAQKIPLILGEIGQDDRGSAFNTSLMDWLDALQSGGGNYPRGHGTYGERRSISSRAMTNADGVRDDVQDAIRRLTRHRQKATVATSHPRRRRSRGCHGSAARSADPVARWNWRHRVAWT
jgi:hypothetical protein